MTSADERDDDRLPSHHGPHLGLGHANRPEQTEFAGPLMHGKGKRVDDPKERDDHRQEQHHRHEGQELIDEATDLLRIARPVQHLRIWMGRKRPGDG